MHTHLDYSHVGPLKSTPVGVILERYNFLQILNMIMSTLAHYSGKHSYSEQICTYHSWNLCPGFQNYYNFKSDILIKLLYNYV